MKIIVTGATGLVGAEVVRQALASNQADELILVVRNKPDLSDPRITVALHSDFSDYSSLLPYFEKADALIWALGISQTQVSRQQYEVITYNYVINCARYCLQVNPSIRFIFVSGDGADRTEKSRTLFKRIKGKAENGLLQTGLKDLYIARPDAVKPIHKNKKAPFLYKMVYPLFPLVEKFAPNKIIAANVLGRALIRLAKNGYSHDTLENTELKELGR